MDIKKEWDLVAYIVLNILSGAYALYIRSTCEEIGCLAIIFPIFAIFILAFIETLVNLILISKNKRFSLIRRVIFTISAIITFAAALLLVSSIWR